MFPTSPLLAHKASQAQAPAMALGVSGIFSPCVIVITVKEGTLTTEHSLLFGFWKSISEFY
jgi:hypothetical protein